MTERARRGTVVFAGDFNEEFVSTIQQPVRRVRTVFDAIGELTSCSSAGVIETVVVDDALLLNTPNEYLDALRRVDPSSVLIVTSDSKRIAQADAVVPKNTTEAHLTSAIANVKSQSQPDSNSTEIDLDEVLGIADASKYVQGDSSLGDTDLVRALMHVPSKFKNQTRSQGSLTSFET